MSRFRGQAANRPNRLLLSWHYRQCAMMRIRGFAVGPFPVLDVQ
jgi:hypothetical protein